jgi:hypothetical protein
MSFDLFELKVLQLCINQIGSTTKSFEILKELLIDYCI